MSNEVNDVKPEELNTQLRNYGQWLERRSDVALSSVDVAVAVGGEEQGNGPPVGPRLLAIAVAGIALLALAAIGMNAIGNGSSADNVATAADVGGVDTPTSDVEDPPAVAVERPSVTVAPSAAADDSVTNDDAGDVTDPTTSSESEPASQDATAAEGEDSDSALVAEPEVFNDEALTPSTLVLEEGQTSIRPNEGGGATAPGFLFISPRDGATMSLNASHTIEARLVAGAATYTFEMWQDGTKMFDVSTTERTFLMPNQMLTGNPAMSPGQVVLRVIAADASGSVMASGEITVTMQGAVAAATGATAGPWPTNG